MTLIREIMASWQIFQNPLGLCSIKILNFADVNRIFTNIMRVIYWDIKSEIIIVSTLFISSQLILLRFSQFPCFRWNNADISKIWEDCCTSLASLKGFMYQGTFSLIFMSIAQIWQILQRGGGLFRPPAFESPEKV